MTRTFFGHGFRSLGRQLAAVLALDLTIVVLVSAHLAGGMAVGASASAPANELADPLRLLGTTPDRMTCPTVPLAEGEGTTIVCANWTGIVSPGGVVKVVSLYGPDNAVLDAYTGTLPQDLAWGATVTEVWATMGAPRRITSIYGTPTFVYMYDSQVYGSLELQFDAADTLVRINASLTH
ncbi:MAG: hypothetical protein WCK58_06665 [Chloroflexota bacterium]